MISISFDILIIPLMNKTPFNPWLGTISMYGIRNESICRINKRLRSRIDLDIHNIRVPWKFIILNISKIHNFMKFWCCRILKFYLFLFLNLINFDEKWNFFYSHFLKTLNGKFEINFNKIIFSLLLRVGAKINGLMVNIKLYWRRFPFQW